MRERIKLLKKRLYSTEPAVSLERARLITSSYKETQGQPMILRRAKTLAKILHNVKVWIDDHDLLVGHRAPQVRAGVIFPEMSIHWLREELPTLEKRKVDPFLVTEKQREELPTVLDFWEGKTIYDHTLARIPKETKRALEQKVFDIDNYLYNGVSHILIDIPKVLYKGISGIKEEIKSRMRDLKWSNPENMEKLLFYNAALIVCDASVNFARRYAEEADNLSFKAEGKRKTELQRIGSICHQVPEFPATGFWEAAQSLWFVFLINYLETDGMSISLGRFDQYMYPYYMKDIDAGRITQADALELIECLWIKLTEIVELFDIDCAENFAGFPMGFNLVVGGQDRNGQDATNELSYLCLKATAEVKVTQPNLSIRLHTRTPSTLLREASKVIREGIGMPEVFNDEAIIPAVLNQGISLEEARDYAPVGCVEFPVLGADAKTNIALFNLCRVLELVLKENSESEIYSFSDFEKKVQKKMEYFIEQMTIACNVIDRTHAELVPTPYLSILIPGCIEKGVDVSAGGARYNFSGVQAVGVANFADSLVAVKKLVFEEKKITLRCLIKVLSSNFEKAEHMRQMLLQLAPKYGNDEDYVDLIAAKWTKFYCQEVQKYHNPRGGKFIAGLYSVSSHIPLGREVGATPDGRKAREPLADGGLSPAQGKDRKGPTAVLKSVSKIDHSLAPNGTLTNLKFNPQALAGEERLGKFQGFLRSFVDLKCSHVQFNIISADVLKEAQKNPEKYANLLVRVAGYSARFVELDEHVQEDIIKRTEHMSI